MQVSRVKSEDLGASNKSNATRAVELRKQDEG